MNHRNVVLIVLLFGIVTVTGKPQNAPPSSPIPTATEASKVSKFFDDVSSVFKQGTVKVKESFESAASSVKDGVVRGYGYVKDKLTGPEVTPASNSTESAPTSSAAVKTSTVPVRSGRTNNDDEDRLVFTGDKETGLDSSLSTSTTTKRGLEDRFIIDGPLACKAGQSVVNGSCRNIFT